MLAVAAPEEAGQTREAVSLPHGDPEPLRYLRLGRCSCRPSVPGIQFDRTFSRPSKSYILDRRNTYGESPHGARKSIPGGKAGTHRAEQHQVRQALHQAERADPGDAGATEVAETAIASAKLQRLSGFKKVPDAPLGVVVARKQGRRVADHKANGRFVNAGRLQ